MLSLTDIDIEIDFWKAILQYNFLKIDTCHMHK